MKVDILAIGVHPDDVELCCSGTILSHIALGYSVGILDLTKGELGTRGNATIRLREAKKAASILGVRFRENLGLSDGFFINNRTSQIKIIEAIRKHKPDIVLANAISDRHPDHGRSAKLVADATFLSGLVKIDTYDENGNLQDRWRPKQVFHYIQDHYIRPDFIVNITPFAEKKFESILAYKSQFYDPNSKEPSSPISSANFLEFIESRSREFGRLINADFGEGFTCNIPIHVKDIMQLG